MSGLSDDMLLLRVWTKPL